MIVLRRLNPVDLIAAVQAKVKEKTELECYDDIPKDAPSPFYHIEFINRTPKNSKTMYRDVYTVWIHSIAEASNSSVGVYNLINKLEEALSEYITLDPSFEIINQTDEGVLNVQTDETGEKHAVSSFSFDICYGYKCKI